MAKDSHLNTSFSEFLDSLRESDLNQDLTNALLDETNKTSVLSDLSTSKKELVLNIARSDRQAAAYALASFNKTDVPIASSKDVEGILAAKLHSRGITTRFREDARKLREYRNETEKALQTFETSSEQMQRDFAAFFSNGKSQIEGAISELRAALDKERIANTEKLRSMNALIESELDTQKTRVGELEKSHKEQLEKIREQYQSGLALEAPVSFWESNQASHESSARRFLIGFTAIFPAVFAAMGFLGWYMLASDQDQHWGKTALFIFLTGVVLWISRITVRLYLSHKHLATDAKERVVLAKTYISLMASDSGPGPDQQAVVYQALFRPSSTGILGSSESPQNAFSIFYDRGRADR